VFLHAHGHGGGRRVRVVRRADGDGVDALGHLVEHLAEVGVRFRLRVFFTRAAEPGFVGVADGDNIAGAGGNVNVTRTGDTSTVGDSSVGILAQSIGGGGGDGGLSIAGSIGGPDAKQISASVGGFGGPGATGGGAGAGGAGVGGPCGVSAMVCHSDVYHGSLVAAAVGWFPGSAGTAADGGSWT